MLQIIDEDGPSGAKLVARTPFRVGDLIQSLSAAKPVSAPTYQTIQTSCDVHITELGNLAYLNHSCWPNTCIDIVRKGCYTIRDVAVGEELTFFYPSTEWEMSRPFVCGCGRPECIFLIAGAKYIPLNVLGRYFVNQHIRELALTCLQATVEG